MRARAAPTERCARPRPAWSRARASRNSAPPHAQPHSAVPFLPLTCLSAAMRVRLGRLTRYLFPREGDELLKSLRGGRRGFAHEAALVGEVHVWLALDAREIE